MRAERWQPGDTVYRVSKDGELVRGVVERREENAVYIGVVVYRIVSGREDGRGVGELTAWPDDYVFATELEAWERFQESVIEPRMATAYRALRDLQALDGKAFLRIAELKAGAEAMAGRSTDGSFQGGHDDDWSAT